MLSERVHTFDDHDVCVVVCKGIPYFKAQDVANVLHYADATQAVRKNVSQKYVRTLTELRDEASGNLGSVGQDILEPLSTGQFIPKTTVGRPALFISEPGVTELMWHSRKPEALRFRQWVLEEVLPEIRRTGSYVRHEQVSLMN